jgi:hypothetical protein
MMGKLFQRIPLAVLAFALIALPHLIFVISKWHAVPLHDGLPVGPSDPDPWLRLTIVRDWLMGGSWYDHSVAHSNAPWGGITSPWTRPLDVVIAMLVHFQPDSVELNLRLMRAALLLPWIWMMLLLVGVYRLVRISTIVPCSTLMASVLIASMPLTWNYFGIGNADHHAPLAVLFIWALHGLMREAPKRRHIIVSGLLLALQLWVSFEALILIGAMYLWYGVHWLRGNRESATTLALLATSIALGSAIAVMIEHPSTQWLVPIYDAISIVYVVILMLAALLAWALMLAPRMALPSRVIVGGMGSFLVIGAIASIYPLALYGPMAMADPFIISDFLPRITEAKPAYSNGTLYTLAVLIQPLVALWLCIAAWLNPSRSFYTKDRALKLGCLVAFALILYINQQRWSYYLLPLVAATLAPILGALFTPEHPSMQGRWPARPLFGLSANQQMVRRLPIILLLVGLPIALLAGHAAYENRESAKLANDQMAARESCYLSARALIYSGALATVDGLTDANLLAPTDLGAEIMFFTPHHIVASNYHREGPGIAYVWGADKLTDEKALRAHLAKRRINAILICPKVDPEKDSLLQAYVHGKPLPRWLKKINYVLPARPKSPTDQAQKNPPITPLILRVMER